MKCSLINYTSNAAAILIFAKSTRLAMRPELLAEIENWPEEKKRSELAYIANSIPSSWEFVDYVFMIEDVSRAFTHQFVRTRHGSYAQQSLRVVDASDFEFVTPARIAALPLGDPLEVETAETVNDIRLSYSSMLRHGASPEEARSILPTNVATNILAKFNLRTLSELCRARIGARVQDEYVSVVQAMRAAVLDVHPWAEPFLTPRKLAPAAEIDEFANKHRQALGDEARRDLLKIADRLRQER